MKKIYSLVLMAAALLVGTNAWAVDVATWAELTAAAATPNAEITLTANVTMPTTGGTFDLNGATIGCSYATTSPTTGNDTTIYPYIIASKAKTYTLQNVTLKNYQGAYGAIYISAANATVNLESTVNTVDCKYSVYANKAATITNGGNVNGLYLKVAGSEVTNNGIINGIIYSKAGCNVTNNGTINGGAYAMYAAGTISFENNGAINASSYTFYVRENAVLDITNNADIDWSIFPYKENTNDQTITNNAGNFAFMRNGNSKYFGGNVTISGSNGATVTIDETADTRYGNSASLTLNNITVAGGIIRTQVQGSNITVTGGTFVTAPAAGATGTIAGECKFPAGPATGGLTIAAGYRGVADGHIYAESVTPGPVIMLTHNSSTQTFEYLDDAFAAAEDGDEISLLDDIDQLSTIWIGTETMYGTAKSLTLDLAGHSITADPRVGQNFIISHGSLLVKNSVPGQGGIYNMTSGEVFALYGSYLKNCDPRINTPFTHLTVEEGVDLYAQQTAGSGVVISEIKNDKILPMVCDFVSYLTNIYSSDKGVANGVRVDMKGNVYADKYGVKVNGNVTYPYDAEADAMRTVDPLLFPDYQQSVARSDSAYTPYIYIYPSAKLITSAGADYAVAVYSSGYGRWLIAGTCTGATGLYAKSGDIELDDAIIESTYTEEAFVKPGGSSGVESAGNAIVIESNVHYPGLQDIDINGDTKVSTNSEGGSALIDVVSDASNTSLVDGITINGGSFSGDKAIVISEKTATDPETEITVGGVSLIGETQVGQDVGEEAVNRIIDPTEVHMTVVENPDGTTTVVVSAGTTPTPKTEWTDIAALASGSNANWTGFTPGVVGDGQTQTSITLGELQIISGYKEADPSTVEHLQELTIKDKATLIVNRLIMNDYARIIVEAGGKLIVAGEQGINAPVAENIVLKTSAANPARFLFNPAVTSNRHPNATVELLTKSWWRNASNYEWERFGVPTHNAIQSITCEPTTEGIVYAEVAVFENNAWESLGYIGGSYSIDASRLDKPFATYNVIAYRDNNVEAPVIKMAGELVGNINAELNADRKWAPFANSYTADVDVYAMLHAFETEATNVDPSVYLATSQGQGHYAWDAYDADWAEDLELKMKPMQAFILWNKGAEAEVNMINYNSMVWTPATSAGAPARRVAANDNTAKMRVIIANEQGISDNVKLKESESNKAIEKFFNDDVNIYAMADEKSSIVAVDDLADSYLGVSTVNGGNFTISFANVAGREFDLIDLETGARVAANEGETYTFHMDANTTNDYRFKVVERKVATAMENTEAVKSAKGIYTITGQYVGEMNVWNSLPAGVYVINGAKCVK